METPSKDIVTERLLLRPMLPAFLEATLSTENKHDAAVNLGLSVPDEWFSEVWVANLRLGQLRANPDYQEWSLRAIADKTTHQMIGHIGFHTEPSADYLAPWAPAGVEFGYTIYPSFRRRGFAREAALGMMRWAYEVKGVPEFVVTVAPGNMPSMNLATSLGFVPVGTHQDEIDGEEVILLLSGERLQQLIAGLSA
jgi:ribosomal-protein-alanine N-acetyltransferase